MADAENIVGMADKEGLDLIWESTTPPSQSISGHVNGLDQAISLCGTIGVRGERI